MAKRIKWTKLALDEKIEIFKYWNKRNKSNDYSKKLNRIIQEAIRLIQEYPSLGRPTDDPEVKNILAKDYLIFYIETKSELYILHIWDERRDPDKMIYKRK
jgi:toxin YoeB